MVSDPPKFVLKWSVAILTHYFKSKLDFEAHPKDGSDMGLKSPINLHSFKANFLETLFKHPRFSSAQDNLLDYIKDAKTTMDRKKATLEAKFRLFMAKVLVKFYPTKLATFPLTTLWFSNVAGPQDHVSHFGIQVAFMAASVYGQPVALMIHIISCAKKISMVLSVDDTIIPDFSELCDDFEEAFNLIKNVVKGLINN
ncbi:Detected protein of unknown function [Hibiscus syriacus]|uniref:O-acyltransferase WSD1 C-terminal domain-containing protein n=1 Tax=Hibiscus syriacus TaxID=106335 RepID=A0A6A3CUZ1_HIBSY|nr:Detected protein of unknown function [Hibiscus syriacus]